MTASHPAGAPPLDWHSDLDDGVGHLILTTQPYRGWTETSRPVRVPMDGPGDGIQRTTSPDCPEHGSLVHPGSSARRGARGADGSSRNGHTDARLAPALGDGSPPMLWSTDQPDEVEDLDGPAATRRSTPSSRTGHGPSTTPADTPFARTPRRTDDTPDELGSSAPGHDTDESSTEPADSDGHHQRTGPRTADTEPLASPCTCSYWIEIDKTERTSHYATFPEALPRKLIECMCPAKVCTVCGKPSERIAETANSVGHAVGRTAWTRDSATAALMHSGPITVDANHSSVPDRAERVTLGWTDCGHDAWRPGLVLDPFGGSGTTGVVAQGLGRDCLLIDIDERNAGLARERIGMFMEVSS